MPLPTTRRPPAAQLGRRHARRRCRRCSRHRRCYHEIIGLGVDDRVAGCRRRRRRQRLPYAAPTAAATAVDAFGGAGALKRGAVDAPSPPRPQWRVGGGRGPVNDGHGGGPGRHSRRRHIRAARAAAGRNMSHVAPATCDKGRECRGGGGQLCGVAATAAATALGDDCAVVVSRMQDVPPVVPLWTTRRRQERAPWGWRRPRRRCRRRWPSRRRWGRGVDKRANGHRRCPRAEHGARRRRPCPASPPPHRVRVPGEQRRRWLQRRRELHVEH